MEEILNNYKIFNELKLDQDFIQNIQLFHVFKDEDYTDNAFIVTNDDKVYAFGYNWD